MPRDEHLNETYRSMIAVSVEGFKALQYLHGGALVAILAYLTQGNAAAAFSPHAKAPVAIFSLGLALGSACFATSYLTQFALFNEEQGAGRTGFWGVGHMVWARATLFLGLGSLVLFVVGVFVSVCALP